MLLLLFIFEDLLSAELNRSHQLELTEEVFDSAGCAVEYHFDECASVSATHKHLALDEDRRGNVSVRSLDDDLHTDLLHQLRHLSLDEGLGRHQILREVRAQRLGQKGVGLVEGSQILVRLILDGFDTVRVLHVESVLHYNSEDLGRLPQKRLTSRLIISDHEPLNAQEQRLLVLVECLGCSVDKSLCLTVFLEEALKPDFVCDLLLHNELMLGAHKNLASLLWLLSAEAISTSLLSS